MSNRVNVQIAAAKQVIEDSPGYSKASFTASLLNGQEWNLKQEQQKLP